MKILFTHSRISYSVIGTIELLLGLLAQIFYPHPFSVRSLLDSFSTISLLFFSVGLIIFLVQDGAFDSVVYGFKRFARAVRRNQLEDSDEEAPLTELKRHDGKKRAALTWPLIIDSLLLFALAFSVSLLM